MISQPTEGAYKDRLYFNSTRNYTLALLDAFNSVHYFVETDDENIQKLFTIPIQFGNYEKALVLEERTEHDITSLNFNYLPRLILSFEGMTKTSERQTQKYQKFKKVIDGQKMNFAYNSVAYDFNFRLLLQTRGLTIATQVTETILSKFNPSLNLEIQEFPLLDPTETQILIADPQFEIMEDFENTDINIVNVTFDIIVRGNIYGPIDISGMVTNIGMYVNVWEKKMLADSKLASYWGFGPDKIVQRSFDGTGPGTIPSVPEPILSGPEDELIKEREDYVPYENVTTTKDKK